MTEEEQIIMEMIEQGLIPLDQFSAAANQYGQGADYLNMEDTPVQWDRAGDMDDLIGDMLKRTGLYFEDLVPLPYETVEDPGEYSGYEDYDSILSQGNVAIDTVREAMATDGLSFDEAVNLVIDAASSDDPADADLRQQLLPGLPQTEDGQIDRDSFRSFAADAVAGGAQEGTERAQYDSEKAAYDDYVRARTGLDINPLSERKPDFATGFSPAEVANVEPARMPGPNAPVMPTGSAVMFGNARYGPRDEGAVQPGVFRTDSTIRPGNVAPAPQKNSQGDYRTAPSRKVQRDSQGRSGSDISFDRNKSYNAGYNRAYEATQKARQNQQVASKKDENMARLIHAYNQIIYGGRV